MPMDRSRLWEQQFSPVSVQRVRSDEAPAAECRLLNEFRDSARPRRPRDGGTFAGQEPSVPGLHAERSIAPHRPPTRQREGRPCPESHPFVGGVVAVVVQPVIGDGRGRNGVPDHQVGVGADRDRPLARVKSVQLGEHSSSSEIGTETLVVRSSCRNVRIISSNMAMPSLLRAARVALSAASTVPRGRVPEACRQAPSRGVRQTVVAEFSFLIDRGNLQPVPDVAEVPFLPGVRQKAWSEYGDTFAPCPADAVIGNAVPAYP